MGLLDAIRNIFTAAPVAGPDLVQGSGVFATKTSDGGVATAAQLSVAAGGKDTVAIAVASEAFDNAGGGASDLVGNEAAVVDLDDDNDAKAHWGYNAVAKVRMDNAAPVRHRVLGRSAAFTATAQVETGFQDLLFAVPGSIDHALINAPGNPGAMFAQVSGNMGIWHDGAYYLPVLVDGFLWGVPLTYLGP